MNKIQRGILFGYCIAVLLLCFVFVPWRVKAKVINEYNRDLDSRQYYAFAPLWTNWTGKMLQSKFSVSGYVYENDIVLGHLTIELICITLITIAACLAFSNRGGS